MRQGQAHLSGTDLDIEVTPLVRDLEDLGPGKAVDPQPITVDEQAIGTDAKHDVDALRVLCEKEPGACPSCPNLLSSGAALGPPPESQGHSVTLSFAPPHISSLSFTVDSPFWVF